MEKLNFGFVQIINNKIGSIIVLKKIKIKISQLEFSNIQSSMINLTKILIEEFNGYQTMIDISNSDFSCKQCVFNKMRTSSPYIFQAYYSTLTITSSIFFKFYPQLIYASFSSLSLDKCKFIDSFVKFGIYEICAVKLVFNASYTIQNCLFMSMNNLIMGPVDLINS